MSESAPTPPPPQMEKPTIGERLENLGDHVEGLRDRITNGIGNIALGAQTIVAERGSARDERMADKSAEIAGKLATRDLDPSRGDQRRVGRAVKAHDRADSRAKAAQHTSNVYGAASGGRIAYTRSWLARGGAEARRMTDPDDALAAYRAARDTVVVKPPRGSGKRWPTGSRTATRTPIGSPNAPIPGGNVFYDAAEEPEIKRITKDQSAVDHTAFPRTIVAKAEGKVAKTRTNLEKTTTGVGLKLEAEKQKRLDALARMETEYDRTSTEKADKARDLRIEKAKQERELAKRVLERDARIAEREAYREDDYRTRVKAA